MAPKVAHLAALLLKEYPDASPDLLRALILAHSRHPAAASSLDQSKLFQLMGYGKPDWESAIYSSERRVSLVAEDTIGEDQHQYYEIPIPGDFFGPPVRRQRRISVALAHTPLVRRTRIEYKGSTINFKVVKAKNIDQVMRIFRRTKKDDREDNLPEYNKFQTGGTSRGKGTAQASTWQIERIDARWNGNRLFVVVTRKVPPWAAGFVENERYALVMVVEDQNLATARRYT